MPLGRAQPHPPSSWGPRRKLQGPRSLGVSCPSPDPSAPRPSRFWQPGGCPGSRGLRAPASRRCTSSDPG
eukprot:9501210-Alexandrium_andersonii.AAC.1